MSNPNQTPSAPELAAALFGGPSKTTDPGLGDGAPQSQDNVAAFNTASSGRLAAANSPPGKPGSTPSVILSPSQPPPVLEHGPARTQPPTEGALPELREDTRRVPRKEAETARELALAHPPRGRSPVGQGDVDAIPKESWGRVVRWGAAGLMVALLLVAAAWFRKTLNGPPTSVSATGQTDRRREEPPPPQPLQHEPPEEALLAAPVAVPAPPAAPSSAMAARARAPRAPRTERGEDADAKRKRAAVVPGLEDLKRDY